MTKKLFFAVLTLAALLAAALLGTAHVANASLGDPQNINGQLPTVSKIIAMQYPPCVLGAPAIQSGCFYNSNNHNGLGQSFLNVNYITYLVVN